jgi:hypothetical protein
MAAVAQSIHQGQIPHGKCQQMLVFSQTLVETIGDEIGKAKAQAFALQLAKAYEVELILSQLGSGKERDDQLADLDKISGVFEATAISIRAAK